MKKARGSSSLLRAFLSVVGMGECVSNFLAGPAGVGEREAAGVGEHIWGEVTPVPWTTYPGFWDSRYGEPGAGAEATGHLWSPLAVLAPNASTTRQP